MCLKFHKAILASGGKSPFEAMYGTGTSPTRTSPTRSTGGQEPQDYDDRSFRRYRRAGRRSRGEDYWEERRARRQERQAARADDLRIPEPDINHPNPTPEGGINY